MKAQPGPMVSGSHFFPKAPLLWVKWMPACEVMSRNVMLWAVTGFAFTKSNNQRHTEPPRETAQILLVKCIYLEAPEETASRALPARPAVAAAPTWVVAVTGSGTETCSWTAWRSLLSSGCNWRYGPVMACDDSSAL